MGSVVVDERVTQLARGERPASWGVNLNACSPPPAELAAAVAEMGRALAAIPGANLYAYDTAYLHVTVASPFPFTAEAPALTEDADQRRRAEEAAVRAVRALPADAHSMELHFTHVELGRDASGCPTAVILRAAPSAAIDTVRTHLPRLLHADADACELGLVRAGGDGWDGLAKAPRLGFVHSTIARFFAQPSAPLDDVVAAIERCISSWKPITVRSGLRLVRESAPYMHVDVDAEALLVLKPME